MAIWHGRSSAGPAGRSRKARRTARRQERMGQVLLATCVIVMALTLAGSRVALSMAVLVFAGMLVWAAVVSTRQAGPRALDGMA